VRRLVAPQLDPEADKVTAFENTFASAGAQLAIDYQLTYPKHEFLRYLVTKRDVVLHGSGNGAIDVFEPTWQTDYFGRVRYAVFAASDGIWPMFYAILDRSRYHGSLRSVCYWNVDTAGERQRCYGFSINAAFLERQPWREGCIYVLSRATFQRVVDEDGSPSEEWLSTRTVTPVARLAVSPSDFPFLKDVEGHGDERTDRFEELVYQLGAGAQELTTHENALRLVLAPRLRWRERAAEFAALLPAVLPDLRAETVDDEHELVLKVSGSGSDHDRLAVALQLWSSSRTVRRLGSDRQ
jgi:hypothetical protein